MSSSSAEERQTTPVHAVMPAEANEEGLWACPDCDRKFPTPNALSQHLYRSHGYMSSVAWAKANGFSGHNAARDARRHFLQLQGGGEVQESELKPQPQSGHRAELRQTVVAPLRQRLRRIDNRIQKVQGEIAELRDERRDIEFILKRLDPTSFVSKPGGNGSLGRSPDVEKKRLISEFVMEHREDFEGGFTRTMVHDRMKESELIGLASPDTVQGAIEEMRDAGLVRADKVVRGGGMQFKFVGANGAGPTEEGDDA